MSPILPRFNAAMQRIDDERKLAKILLESGADLPDDRKHSHATAPGDTRKLRGIPAIGRGVAGVMPRTNPTSELARGFA